MRDNYLRFLFLTLLALQGALFSPVYAESWYLDFHANAKMMYGHHGAVDNAYGLINVVIDERGQGRMEVMFYNGSEFDWIKFNADVRFMDANGRVLDEAHVYRWMESAGLEGADERKVSKSLSIDDVKSIEVDFYLTEQVENGIDEIAEIETTRLFF